MEGEGVLEACCVCVFDDREAISREALKASRDVPSVRSQRVLNPS